MDAKTNLEQVTCPSAGAGVGQFTANAMAVELMPLDVAEAFKRTPCIAGLKPGGRYIAQDMFDVGGIPPLMKMLPDHGYLHGECMTVTDRTIAENVKSVTWNPDQDVVYPSGSHEKQSHADA